MGPTLGGGESAGGEETGKGRSQKAPECDCTRRTSKVEDTKIKYFQAQKTRYKLYRDTRKMKHEEKNAVDPDEPFIKLLEQYLKHLRREIGNRGGV